MAQQFDINKRLMALLKNEIQAQKQMNSLAKQKSQLESNLGEYAASCCSSLQWNNNNALLHPQQHARFSDCSANWIK